MADIDWDPFGTPESEILLTAPAPPAPNEGGAEQPQGDTQRIFKEDMEAVATAIMQRMKKDRPWDVMPFDAPDTLYGDITCPLDDWRHVDVKCELGRGIAYIIFNRPNENNSIQETLSHGLQDALLGLHKSPHIRVGVFTGEGRMFCAGGDPKAWQAQASSAKSGVYTGDGTVGTRIERGPTSPEVDYHLQELGYRALKAGAFPDGNVDISRLGAAKTMSAFAKLPQFTIALVNGSAMGGGVGYVCCCDYVVALRRAYLVLSEVKIGVIPATISPYVIAKIGVSNGKRFFCAADNIPAQRATQYGMVNEVVENMKEGHERIRELCKLMSKCGPRAVDLSKRLCMSCAGQPITQSLLNYTVRVQTDAALSEEGILGQQALSKGEEAPWGEIGYDVWPTVGETIPGAKKKS